jgi:hypothetical protein
MAGADREDSGGGGLIAQAYVCRACVARAQCFRACIAQAPLPVACGWADCLAPSGLPCVPQVAGPTAELASLANARFARTTAVSQRWVARLRRAGQQPSGTRLRTQPTHRPPAKGPERLSRAGVDVVRASAANASAKACGEGLRSGCVRSREAQRCWPARRRRASTSDSRRLSERSERRERSEFGRGAGNASIAGKPRRGQAVCPTAAPRHKALPRSPSIATDA